MSSTVSISSRQMPLSGLGAPNRFAKFQFDFSPVPITPRGRLSEDVLEGFFTNGSVPPLPFTLQSTYDREQTDGEMPTIVLENEHMRATVYPQYGGRLASWYDKRAKSMKGI